MSLKKLVLGLSMIGRVAISSIGKPSVAQRSPVIPKNNKIQLFEQPYFSSNQNYLRKTKDLSITSGSQFFTALFQTV